jgi:ABC-type molybdate transport system permease subunit
MALVILSIRRVARVLTPGQVTHAPAHVVPALTVALPFMARSFLTRLSAVPREAFEAAGFATRVRFRGTHMPPSVPCHVCALQHFVRSVISFPSLFGTPIATHVC